MNAAHIKYSKGFSLIEVLVAFVIASVGLLGLAAMQLVTLKNVNNTQFRTVATLYAYDMAERMRSNRTSVGEYVDVDTSQDAPCGRCGDGGSVAALDVTAWAAALTQGLEAGGLPEGVGTITRNGEGLYEVTIGWDEQSRDNSGGLIDTQSYTLTVDI